MPADDPVAHGGSQDDTPVSTKGFGAREDTDATRQAQHTESNDAPTDVNMNAVVCREQAATLTLMGKSFEANADRRNKVFDHLAAIWGSREKA